MNKIIFLPVAKNNVSFRSVRSYPISNSSFVSFNRIHAARNFYTVIEISCNNATINLPEANRDSLKKEPLWWASAPSDDRFPS